MDSNRDTKTVTSVSKRLSNPGYDMHLFMNPTELCNFDCSYCGQHTNDRSMAHNIDIDRFITRLEKTGRTFLVTISGGEAFMIPNFIEFAVELTKKHYIRIDTNFSLTKRLQRFAEAVNPDRVVEIVFSTHIAERERSGLKIEPFIKLLKDFQTKGFRMVGNYVTHPTLLDRVEQDIKLFASHGIKILPTLFQGVYDGKIYSLDHASSAYSKAQLDLITGLNPLALLPLVSQKNKPCQAGCSTLYLDENYEVSPCYMLRKTVKMGTFYGDWGLFPKVIRCPRKVCTDQYNQTLCTSLPDFANGLAYGQSKAIADHGIASRGQSMWLFARILPQSLKSKFARVAAKFGRLKWRAGKLVDPATWHRSDDHSCKH